jgi:aspartate 1-decarboxylase
MTMEEAKTHKPRVVVLGPGNKVERITSTPGSE